MIRNNRLMFVFIVWVTTHLVFSTPKILHAADVGSAGDLTASSWVDLRDRSTDLYRQGNIAEAHTYAEAALQAALREYGPNHPETAVALKNLSASLLMQGKTDESLPLIQEAYEITSKTVGSDHIYHILNAGLLAENLRRLKNLEQAEYHFQEAVWLFETQDKKFNLFRASTLSNYSMLLADREQYGLAKTYLNQAIDFKRDILGKDHPDVIQIQRNLEDITRRSKQ